jgi:peptidyl-prolyl cis-trans isomerase SDCCAG10
MQGDPTGSGHGGESVYGPGGFKDEFHSRLRFTRRGLVGMASSGPNANQSQFFLSLGPCEFLNRRHTLFAKITGDTLFNLTRFGELEIEDATPLDARGNAVDDDKQGGGGGGHSDRPFNPPKILRTDVLMNPFDDIVPRAKKIAPSAPVAETQPKKKQKKNLALLSFAEDEVMDGDTFAAAMPAAAAKVKSKSSHDLLQGDARLSRTSVEQVAAEDSQRKQAGTDEAARQAVREALAKKSAVPAPSAGDDEDGFMDEGAFDAHMRAKLLRSKGIAAPIPAAASSASSQSAAADAAAAAPPSSSEQKQSPDTVDVSAARSSYAKLKAEMGLSSSSGPGSVRSQALRTSNEASVDDALLSPLEQRRSKYKTRKQNAQLSSREADTLAKLAAFKQSIAAAASSTAAATLAPSRPVEPADARGVAIPPVPVMDDAEEAALDAEALRGTAWLGHKLKVARRPQDFDAAAAAAARRDVEGINFAVHDPRGEEGSRELKAGFGGAPGGGKHSRRHHPSREGTAGVGGGGKGGLTGVHLGSAASAAAAGYDSVKWKSAREHEDDAENERVVARMLERERERQPQQQQQSRKRSHSRSRSRSRSRERDRARA